MHDQKSSGREGKAALARTHSKTCRGFGGFLVRDASWSAEQSSALEEFCRALRSLAAGLISLFHWGQSRL
jgi:hypothetical protein